MYLCSIISYNYGILAAALNQLKTAIKILCSFIKYMAKSFRLVGAKTENKKTILYDIYLQFA